MKPPSSQLEVKALPTGLYLVSTPIGNLRDMTFRAIDVLSGADLIACEDTRVTRTLLQHYGIETRSMSYHEHNAAKERPKILKLLSEGKRIALVSDAGTPLISDPGYKLVREAAQAGIAVFPIPGASSVLAGLCASGLPTDHFFFGGFLPPKESGVKKMAREYAAMEATLIFFESPNRLGRSLPVLASVLGAREAAVARELTKKFEEVRRGSLQELASYYENNEPPRGEAVVIIGPPQAGESAPEAPDIESLLRKSMARQSLRDAVAEVTALSGAPKKMVYELALRLRDEG